MHGNPVTIRTLDPPLHEFLPKKEDLMVEIAEFKASAHVMIFFNSNTQTVFDVINKILINLYPMGRWCWQLKRQQGI